MNRHQKSLATAACPTAKRSADGFLDKFSRNIENSGMNVIRPDSPYWEEMRMKRLRKAAPDLLKAAETALLVLEGIMPRYDPFGDHSHDGWHCIKELKAVINKAKGIK